MALGEAGIVCLLRREMGVSVLPRLPEDFENRLQALCRLLKKDLSRRRERVIFPVDVSCNLPVMALPIDISIVVLEEFNGVDLTLRSYACPQSSC